MTDQPNTVVIDIDGTIANVEKRLHLVQCEKPNFKEFYAQISTDTLNPWAERLMHALSCCSEFEVQIVSARPRTLEKETRQWLHGKIFPGDYDDLHLLRRDVDDDTPDQQLKVEWAKAFGPEKILFWVDDRQRVVDAIRSLGITVLQCQQWTEKGRGCPNCEAGAIVAQTRPYGPKQMAHAAARLGDLATGHAVTLMTVVDAARAELIRRAKKEKSKRETHSSEIKSGAVQQTMAQGKKYD